MTISTKALIAAWTAIAVAALVATWSQNLAYFTGGAGAAADAVLPFWRFILDTKANPASRSITVDILFFTLAGVIFMVLEARRLRLRFVWAYVVLGFLVAISVTFPLFMAVRQLRLDSGPGDSEGAPRATVGDVVGLGLTGALVLALTAFILSP